MSSPISSSLLSPFLFIRYFFTITLRRLMHSSGITAEDEGHIE